MNLRLKMLDPDNLLPGDKTLMMAVVKGPKQAFLTQPCVLQMEIEEVSIGGYKQKTWINVPFENGAIHPYANVSQE